MFNPIIWFIRNVLTGFDGTGRIKADAQPTSFEQGRQFKIFHRFVDIPATTQVAFRFESLNASNIMARALRGAEGGREYLVIPDDGSYAVQSALITTPVAVGRVNNQVTTTTSGVTVNVGLLTCTNRFTIGTTDQFPNGDMYLTDGNNNRANTATTADSNLSGVSENQAFFLVFDHLGSTNPSRFQFFLQWEEIL